MATLTVWPSADELAAAEKHLTEAHHALNEIELRAHALVNGFEPVDEGSPAAELPTFEELGRLSRFIRCVEQDTAGIRQFLGEIQRLHDFAAVRKEPADA